MKLYPHDGIEKVFMEMIKQQIKTLAFMKYLYDNTK